MRRARRAAAGGEPFPPWFQLPPSPDPCAPVLVLGAGLGGCALARALADRGRSVRLIERGGDVAAGASGNPAAVARPFVTRAPSWPEAFFDAAFETLLRWLGEKSASGETIARRARFDAGGVLQLTEHAWPERDAYRVLAQPEASAFVGGEMPSGGLAFTRAGWLDPAALCRALLDSPRIECVFDADVVAIERLAGARWSLTARDGRRWRAPLLVLASGTALDRTPWTRALPLLPARGQISRFVLDAARHAPTRTVTGRHYAIPDGDTLYVGATFARGDDDPHVRHADHEANLAGLRALLPALRVRPEALSGHAGVRATTPDRLPLVGPVPDLPACLARYADLARGRPPADYPPLPTIPGLAVLGGFGSRGVVSAPHTAALLADWLDGGRELQAWMSLLHPVRFAVRALRRGAPRATGA